MVRVLLISPYAPPITSTPIPLGLLYIASYLRTKGVSVDLVDLNVEKEKYLTEKLHDLKPDVVGIYSNISNVNDAKRIAKTVKSLQDTKVVVGGPYPSSSPESYLDESVDSVVVGEGEIAFYEYVKGKNKGRIIKASKCIQNLDELAFPALELINIRKYHAAFYKKKPVSSMITSRGCPYNCIFCDHSVSGYRWRPRSPENIIDEIEWQINKIGAREIRFYDDNFTFDIKRVDKLCDLILERNLDFVWSTPSGLRVDKVNRKLLEKMRKAGCWYTSLAPEVGSQKNLDRICKGFRLDKVMEIHDICKELGYVTGGYFTIGYPFETEEDFKDTMNFCLEMDPHVIDCARVIPIKGTPLYKHDKKTVENVHYWSCGQSDLVEKYQKKIFLDFYLRPGKIFSLVRDVGLKQFFDMSRLILHEKFLR